MTHIGKVCQVLLLFFLFVGCASSTADSTSDDPVITADTVFDRTDVAGDLQLLLPFPADENYTVSQGYSGTFSHDEDCTQYSLDFDMPENADIVSVAAGKVVAMREDSNVGGVSSDYLDDDNYVYIDHGYGTMGVYLHMCENCVDVDVGDTVEQGQVIARAGSTGFSSGPHLHFELDSWETGCSISYGFYDVPDNEGLAIEGLSYTSVNTGNSEVPYVQSTIPVDTFDFNGVTLDSGMPWELTRGETYTITGVVTNDTANIAVFLIEDSSWVDGTSAVVNADDTFTLSYTVDATLAAGSYTLAFATSDTNYFETASSRYVLVE